MNTFPPSLWDLIYQIQKLLANNEIKDSGACRAVITVRLAEMANTKHYRGDKLNSHGLPQNTDENTHTP